MTVTCEELVNRGDSRWPDMRPCGRKVVAQELHGSPDHNSEKGYCKIHCQAAIDKRWQRSQDRHYARMAPQDYAWAAARACHQLGLTVEDLKAGKLQEMVKGDER